MAFDSAEKRQSLFSHGGRFWMGKAIVPTGSVDLAHRLHGVTFYSGNTPPSVAAGGVKALLILFDWRPDA